MPKRSQLRSVPSRLEKLAIDRIVKAVGLSVIGDVHSRPAHRDTPPSSISLQDDLNFARVQFTSLEAVPHGEDNEAKAGLKTYRKRMKESPLEHFVACDLAEIYKTYFRRTATISRPAEGGDPGGPFVRFVVAVMRELGQVLSVHTVDAALKKVRRRKKIQKVRRRKKIQMGK